MLDAYVSMRGVTIKYQDCYEKSYLLQVPLIPFNIHLFLIYTALYTCLPLFKEMLKLINCHRFQQLCRFDFCLFHMLEMDSLQCTLPFGHRLKSNELRSEECARRSSTGLLLFAKNCFTDRHCVLGIVLV